MTQPIVREQPRDPRQSECTVCPPWVRCVHFDGRILWLITQPPSLFAAMRGPHTGGGPYAVGVGTAVVACSCNPQHLVLNIPGRSFTDFDSLPAAQAEFRELEALLRAGEAGA